MWERKPPDWWRGMTRMKAGRGMEGKEREKGVNVAAIYSRSERPYFYRVAAFPDPLRPHTQLTLHGNLASLLKHLLPPFLPSAFLLLPRPSGPPLRPKKRGQIVLFIPCLRVERVEFSHK